MRIYVEEERRIELQSEVGRLAPGPGTEAVCDLTRVSEGCLATQTALFPFPASALPFIELLSKEAVGLMSQGLYAFLREERD